MPQNKKIIDKIAGRPASHKHDTNNILCEILTQNKTNDAALIQLTTDTCV